MKTAKRLPEHIQINSPIKQTMSSGRDTAGKKINKHDSYKRVNQFNSK
jgi:hypothetical protein